MSQQSPSNTQHFPSRMANLGFTATVPTDWVNHELPEEDPDFSNPTHFIPLVILSAPYAAQVLTFAARPAYDDGTLHDWAMYLLENNQLRPSAIGPTIIGGIPALVGEASQESDLGPMIVRFAFLEDGGRLLNFTLMTPEPLEASCRDIWFSMLGSFTLDEPHGSRFVESHQSDREPPTTNPITEPAEPIESNVPPNAKSPEAAVDFVAFALANDIASLDEEHSMNANLRNNGVGLVPRLVSHDDEAKCATMAPAALVCFLGIPYGWHIVDDGRRTLVFDPDGQIQIHLHIMEREGNNNDAILAEWEAEIRGDQPQAEFMRISAEGIDALGIRGLFDGENPIEQYHLLYPHPDETRVIRARVTTIPERAKDAGNLAQLLLTSMKFPATSD